jgi:hypothetical protein
MTRLLVGGNEAEHIELRFNPPKTADRDGWLETCIDIVVNGFRGSIRAFVEVVDLVRFGEQLARLHETLGGSAERAPTEGQIMLAVEGDGRGGVSVKGFAYSEACRGNKLEFELDLDQTFLVEPLRVLRAISEQASAMGPNIAVNPDAPSARRLP